MSETDAELLLNHFENNGANIDLLKVLDEYRSTHDFIKMTKLVKEIAMKLESTHHIGDGLLPVSNTATHGSQKQPAKKPEVYQSLKGAITSLVREEKISQTEAHTLL